MDDAVIWAAHIFFIFSYNFFFPVATVKYQRHYKVSVPPPPPPPNPMRSSMHPLIISSVPLICLVCRPDSLSFNPGYLQLILKDYSYILPYFQCAFIPYKLTSRHLISVPENEKTLAIVTIRVQIFSFITLSMCHLNNSSKTVMKYHAPTPSHKRKHKVTIGNKEKNLECGHFVICRNNFVWIWKYRIFFK